MRFDIVTLFPTLFTPLLDEGILGDAVRAGRVSVRFANPRDFAHDKHRTVDDAPYGGGSGMVLMPGPIADAIDDLARTAEGGITPHRVLLTPQGAPFTQGHATKFAGLGALMLVCGRYEGFDERVRSLVDMELSLGDFVLFGGEVAAMAVIEATARLVPGVVGNEASTCDESHVHGLLEYPQYTRPATFRGMDVPDVLRSGNHAVIARWRRAQALLRTRARRPDLFRALALSKDDQKLIDEADNALSPSQEKSKP